MALTAPATKRLIDAVGAQDQLRSDGNLHLYESQAEWREALPGWQLRAEYGIDFEHLDDVRAIAAWQPGLKTEGGTPWMGFRPSLPDSRPVIGPSTREPRVLHAFGHGHLGLTQAAASAEFVAALAGGKPAALDLAPFGAGRFGRAAQAGAR